MTPEEEIERLRRHVDSLQSNWNKAKNELLKTKARLFDILHPKEIDTPQVELKALFVTLEETVTYLQNKKTELEARVLDLVRENRRLETTVDTLMKKITSRT